MNPSLNFENSLQVKPSMLTNFYDTYRLSPIFMCQIFWNPLKTGSIVFKAQLGAPTCQDHFRFLGPPVRFNNQVRYLHQNINSHLWGESRKVW